LEGEKESAYNRAPTASASEGALNEQPESCTSQSTEVQRVGRVCELLQANRTEAGLCECQAAMFEAVSACGIFGPPPPVPSDSLGFSSWLASTSPPAAHAPPAAPLQLVPAGQVVKGIRIAANAKADELMTQDCWDELKGTTDWACVREQAGELVEHDSLTPLPVT